MSVASDLQCLRSLRLEFMNYLLFYRYPQTLDEFYKLKLEGTWEEVRAGKRMKLPTPETWETQLAMHGNKKEVWHSLLGEGSMGKT